MSSLGLLGDYGSSSSSSSSEEDEGKGPEAELPKPQEQAVLANPFKGSASSRLPRPSFMVEAEDFRRKDSSSSSSSTSVFGNPFKAKEEKEKAVLERHVSMTARQEEQRTIEGKKVCWNFRKGRCRFGHKCTFAHDSDVRLGSREALQQQQQQAEEHASIEAQPKPSQQAPPAVDCNAATRYDEGAVITGEDTQGFTKKKKRPGLSEGIVPSKKAMKFHNAVYNK